MLHGTPTLSESLQITYPTPNLIHAEFDLLGGGGGWRLKHLMIKLAVKRLVYKSAI